MVNLDREDVAIWIAAAALALQALDMWQNRKPRPPKRRKKRKGRHSK